MNNYVSPFVSAPSFKPKERQTEHMSTYPLKAQQQKDPPMSLSPLALVRPPTVSSLFPYQTSIHTTVPQYVIFFFKFSFCFCVCTNLSALPLYVFCPSSLASCLSSMWVYQRTPTSPSAFPFSLFHALLQGTGRGKTKRLNILDCTLPEEKQWFDVPCVCQTKLFCLFGPPFFFFLSSLH